MNEDAENAKAASRTQVSAAAAKKLMKETLDRVRKLGAGASALLGRLKKDRSPEAMMGTMDESLAANRTRREQASARVETLYGEIVAKKRAYKAAPAARRRILEAELKSKLTEYKAAERELKVLLENERVLAQVKGRLNEMIAYDMAGVTEELIDDVALDIEDRASEAEARMDASRDLERAGARRERESDREDLLATLDEFDEDAPSALDGELAQFDDEPPVAPATEADSGTAQDSAGKPQKEAEG